ncbi:hypothetical protein J8J27_21525, partial [Mycobacterium tuberculosis]|nr:hypothetical protein [Mycobacterium tuberculosis]
AFDSESGGTAIVVGSSSSDTINVSISSLTAEDLGIVAETAEAAEMTLDPDEIDQFSLADGETLTITISGDAGDSTVTFTGQAGGSTFTGDDLVSALTGGTVTGATATIDADTTFTKNSDGTLTITSATTGSDSSLSLSINTSAATASTDITNMSDLGVDVTSAAGRDAGESLNVLTQDAA